MNRFIFQGQPFVGIVFFVNVKKIESSFVNSGGWQKSPLEGFGVKKKEKSFSIFFLPLPEKHISLLSFSNAPLLSYLTVT
jgi:hypothetical protein